MSRNKDHFYVFGTCFSSFQLPYPDSVLQCYEDRGLLSYIYKVVSVIEDKPNRKFTTITISKFDYARQEASSGTGTSFTDCNRLDITLNNISYNLVNGKKIVVLKSDEISKHLSYKYQNEFTSGKGSTHSGNSTKVDGIYEILPDAYFELTLE